MIGLLRFVGLVNAAIWLGATIYFLGAAEPAVVSPDMQVLLGAKSFPYFSIALAQLLAARYFRLYLICSAVAVLHLAAEWLYLGKYPHRGWLALIAGLCLVGMLQAYWVQPRLAEWHRVQFTRADQRENAQRTYRTWHRIEKTLELIALGGLLVYFWRITNPIGPTRFVSAKVRS